MNLKDIQEPIIHLLDETNQILKSSLDNDVDIINKITDVTPISLGKKIRSTLLYLLAGLHNAITDDLPKVGASIEMLHLSSLVHDDIMDKSQLRRGEKTINASFGDYTSLLWGDFLFIKSFNVFIQTKSRHLIDIVLTTAQSMIEGQMMELENTHNFNLKLDTYHSIVEKKTASLFAGIAKIASLCKDESPDRTKDFYQFGRNFGFIFQITDDLLDIFSKNTGKDHFRDLKEGKITLPIILFLKNNPVSYIQNYNEKNHTELLKLFEKNSIKELVLDQVQEFAKEYLQFLSQFPPSPYNKSLRHLLDFIMNRDY